MGKFLTPIILILIVVALYFTWISPAYGRIEELKARQATLQDALDKSKQVQALIAQLQASRDAVPSAQLDRLTKMVPDNIDNIRLLIELDALATKGGLVMDGLNIPPRPTEEEGAIGGAAAGGYGTFNFSFTVHGTYDQVASFLTQLASGLRLVDITQFTFGPETGEAARRDAYSAGISLNTYWLH